MSVNFDLKLVIDSFKQSLAEASNATKNFSNNANKEFKDTQKGMDGVSKSADNTGISIGGMSLAFIGAEIATSIFGTALNVVKNTISGSITAYLEAEASLKGLQQALNAAGDSSKETEKEIVDFANALSLVTTAEDDAIVKNIGLALNLGLTTEQAKKVTKAALDMGVALGGDLTTNTEALIKSLNQGLLPKSMANVEGFKQLTEAELKNGAAIDLIAKKYKGFAEGELNTADGKIKQLQNEFGNLQEEIGSVVVENDVFKKALSESVETIVELKDYISKNKEQIRTMGLVLGVTAGVLTTYALAAGGAALATTTLGTSIKVATLAAGPFTLTIAAISAATIYAVNKIGELAIGFLKLKKIWLEYKASSAKGKELSDIAQQIKYVNMQIDYQNKKIEENNKLKKDNKPPPPPVGPNAVKQANAEILEDTRYTKEQIANIEATSEIDLAAIRNDGRIRTLEEQQLHDQNVLLSRQQQQLAELEGLRNHELAKAYLITDAEAKKKAVFEATNKYNLDKAKLQAKNELDLQTLTNKQSLEKTKAKNEAEKELDKTFWNGKKEDLKETYDSIATLQTAKNKELMIIGKAAAMASIYMSTAVGVMKAWELGPVIGPILAPVVAIAGAVQAAKVAGLNFENGGIVGGNSFTGDKIQANVNSGEMILNRQQQKNLFDMANNGGDNSNITSAIASLAQEIRNIKLVLVADDTEIAKSASRGVQNGVVIGSTR